MTNNLVARVYQHKTHAVPGFTATYNITWLAYYEATGNVLAAIAREKQIKSWSRAKKIAPVGTMNPEWKDLSADWYDLPL